MKNILFPYDKLFVFQNELFCHVSFYGESQHGWPKVSADGDCLLEVSEELSSTVVFYRYHSRLSWLYWLLAICWNCTTTCCDSLSDDERFFADVCDGEGASLHAIFLRECSVVVLKLVEMILCFCLC